MHMANELLSVPVATGAMAVAGTGLGWICKKVRQELTSEKVALMGVLGAFVFAAQMVNFQLPMMPGTSGHLIGAVFLAVMLVGPHLAAVVLSSVVIIQCLLFQDGGLLAIGCNIVNIAIVPSYVGYFVYRTIVSERKNKVRLFIAAIVACVFAAEAGSALVVVEAIISKVLLVPVGTFLATMAGVHLLVGVMEGLITVAILSYLTAVRPDLIEGMTGEGMFSRKTAILSLVVITVITAAGFSLLASSKPDGLEWSYLERPEQPDFKPLIANDDPRIKSADELHSKIALMPDYTTRGASEEHPVSAGWTSLAGIVGSMVCMGLIWLSAKLLGPTKTAA